MTIDKSMQGGTAANRSGGDIPFGSLKGAVAGGDKAGYARGRGQLNELSRVGDFLSDKVPDSGTVTRAMVANPLAWGPLVAGGIASKIYNTAAGQAYLKNQLVGRANLPALSGSEAAQQGLEQGTGGENALRLRGRR